MNERISLKRWHPLAGEWVIIAPATASRPTDRSLENKQRTLPDFNPDCYLCPGVQRASGQINPRYNGVFVFNNDFSSLSMSNKLEKEKRHIDDLPARGICRVICFDHRHNVSLAEMDTTSIAKVIAAMQTEYRQLSAEQGIENVLIFENKGEIIGISNLHPHGQIYATDFVPRVLQTEYKNAKQYMDNKGSCLFCSIIEQEMREGQRMVCENNDFVAYVPYFARHAYEVHIIPRRHESVMTSLENSEVLSLAAIYQEVLVRYDNLFEMPFPNITLFHNAPCKKGYSVEPFHFHIEFCPPLRSANQMKYMAGFETGGGNIVNPVYPEEAAQSLRSLSPVHYLQR